MMELISRNVTPAMRRIRLVSFSAFLAAMVGFIVMAVGDALAIPLIVTVGLALFAPAFLIGFVSVIIGLAVTVGARTKTRSSRHGGS
jgi:hypothetical protein